jgi:histidyl-tRNA synthetase
MKAADRRQAAFAVVLGEEELAKGTTSVKNLVTGEQIEVARDDLAEFLLGKAVPAAGAGARRGT